MKVEFTIEGMSCASCVKHIEKALYAIQGIKQAQVNFATGQAKIEKEENVSDQTILLAIRNAGYEAKPAKQQTHAHTHSSDFTRFIISAIVTLPLLLQMVAFEMPGWIQALLATFVQGYGGFNMYKGSYHSLRHGSANMDVLIILGTTAAYVFSLASLVFDLSSYLYFDTSATIITLVLFGRWLESRSKARTSDAIKKLIELQPKIAKVKRNGDFVETPISEIQKGDLFMVRPGENVPVDGIVTEGKSMVNEAFLTGESIPVEKEPSSEIFGATTNQDSVLIAKATKVGDETVLASIIRLVEEAQSSKAPIQRVADEVANIFVPIVVSISLVTFLSWFFIGEAFSDALIHSVAVLVIACPCAIGLATPTVIVVASGKGASLGILFKEVAALERAKHLKSLIIDKTGTLTEGKPKVTDVVSDDPQTLLSLAYSLEQNATHPLATAINVYAKDKGAVPKKVENFISISGKGVKGVIDGASYTLGSMKFAKEEGISFSGTEKLEEEGKTLTLLWKDHTALGAIAIADQLREQSQKAVDRINQMGIHTVMLTGDHKKTAEVVAKKAHVKEYEAEVLPEDKAKKITDYKKKGGLVGMVGDGINDAPALAAADVSFAIGAGSDIAIESADITLVRNDLTSVVDAILLSKATFSKIRQNLFFAFIYNILGIPLAAFGFLNPMIAAFAMAMSSVSVVSNALTLKRWHPNAKN